MYDAGLATLKLPVIVLLSEAENYMMPMVRIAEAVKVGAASLSESAKVWERQGVITRITPASDLRSCSVRLTCVGLDLVNRFSIQAS